MVGGREIDSSVRLSQAKTFLDQTRSNSASIVPARDGSPQIFHPTLTGYQPGDSPRETYSPVKLRNIGPLGKSLLTNTIDGGDADTADQLATLSERSSIFLSVPNEQLSPEMSGLPDFGQTDKGLILWLEDVMPQIRSTKLLAFPGVLKEGRQYRVLQTEGEENLAHLQRAFDLLSLPGEVKAQDGKVTALVEFLSRSERPTAISQAELDDWVNRLASAQVDLGLDIGDEDSSLDNFVRYNGKLYWCDGNLIDARPVTQEQAASGAQSFRAAMQRFVQ